jgi:hypothetical protein
MKKSTNWFAKTAADCYSTFIGSLFGSAPDQSHEFYRQIERRQSPFQSTLAPPTSPAKVLPTRHALAAAKAQEGEFWANSVRVSKPIEGHFLASGSARAGKSITLNATLGSVLQNISKGEIIIDIDAKRSHKPIYHALRDELQAKGIEFYHLDLDNMGSAAIDIAADIDGDPDRLMSFLELFMPDDSNQPFYPLSARQLAYSIGVSAITTHGNNWRFWELYSACQSQINILEEFIKKSPGLNDLFMNAFWNPLEAKTKGNVIASFANRLQSMRLLAGNDYWCERTGGKRFSLNRLMNEGGILLITPSQEIEAVERPLIHLILNLFAKKRNSIPDDEIEHHCYLFVDELPSFGRIKQMPKLFSFSRSKKVSVFATVQQYAQLLDHYETGEVEEILTNADYITFFRNNSPQMDAELVKFFGEELVSVPSFSETVGRDGRTFNRTFSEQVRPRIMQGALSALPSPSPEQGVWCYQHSPWHPQKIAEPVLIPADEIRAFSPAQDFNFVTRRKPAHMKYPPAFGKEEAKRFFLGMPPIPVPVSAEVNYAPGSFEEQVYQEVAKELEKIISTAEEQFRIKFVPRGK